MSIDVDYAIRILNQCLQAVRDDITRGTIDVNNIGPAGTIVDEGVASGGTDITLEDETKNWEENKWVNYIVCIVDGTGKGQSGLIVSNDATTLTVSQEWETPPDDSSAYKICRIAKVEIDLAKGTFITLQPVAPVSISFASLPPDDKVSRLVLHISGDGEVIFPEGTLFPDGIQPKQSGLMQYHCFIDNKGVLTVCEICKLA